MCLVGLIFLQKTLYPAPKSLIIVVKIHLGNNYHFVVHYVLVLHCLHAQSLNKLNSNPKSISILTGL